MSRSPRTSRRASRRSRRSTCVPTARYGASALFPRAPSEKRAREAECRRPLTPLPPLPHRAADPFAPPARQTEYEGVRKQYQDEMRALELKFEPLYASVFDKRRDVVSGATEPAAAAEAAAAAGGGVVGIPHFWLTVMQNCGATRAFIEPHDEPVLEHLVDVKSAYIEGLKGFKLTFVFSPNPFFDNAELTKTFHIPNLLPSAEPEDEDDHGASGRAQWSSARALAEAPSAAPPSPSPPRSRARFSFPSARPRSPRPARSADQGMNVKKIDGCDIAWKAGKNVTVKVTKKKSKGKGKGKAVTQEEELPSFFRFFETPDLEAAEDEDDEEVRRERRDARGARARSHPPHPLPTDDLRFNAWLSQGGSGRPVPTRLSD